MTNNSSPPFGMLLKKYRVSAGLTQEELAERAGLSARGLSDLERGVRRMPYKGTVELLIKALQLSAEEIENLKKAAGRKPAYQALPEDSPAIASLSPLLGRAGEIKQLYRHLAGEGPPVLLLSGEPGIGKTRLLNEVVVQAGTEGWTVLEGSCTRRGGQSLYAPLLEAIAARLNRQPAGQQQTELANCEWLVRLLPELSKTLIPPALKWQFPLEQERRLVFGAVRRYLANIAGKSGTLLILDDLQWAGGDALDLLANLVHSPDPTPLRIIGAYRNTEASPGEPLAVFVADLAHERLIRQLELGPLEYGPATELINSLLENKPAQNQPVLVTSLLERTGRVPFFLISCIKGLQEGVFESNSGVSNLPWDVKQTIRQRITALSNTAQELLGIAAVIGREVSGKLLLAVTTTGWPEREILAALEQACQARLLIEVETPFDISYRFAHDLIREVIEADLSMLRYRMIHRQVADILERKLVAATPELLAYHYRQAGDWENALRHLQQAVESAHSAAAHREEANLLAQAIECARRTGQSQLSFELGVRRGKVCRFLAMWAEADYELTNALANLETGPEQQAELLVTLAEVRHWRLDTPATRRFANQAVQLAEESKQPVLLARALGVLALAESSEGNIRDSLAHFKAAFATAGPANLAAVTSGVELYGLINYWLNQADEAISQCHQALDLARRTYDTTTTARALANLGLALSSKGRYAEAFRKFEEARRFAQEQSMGQWLARAISIQGGVHLELFNYPTAETLAKEARQLSQELNWPLAETSSGIDLLFNYSRTHRYEQAAELIEEVGKAVAAGQGVHGWLWQLRFAAARGEVAFSQGNLREALSRAEYVIERSQNLGRIKYQVLSLVLRGKVLFELKEQDKSRSDLQNALNLARSAANPALLLQAAITYLRLFRDDNLLLEARSIAANIAANLENEEQARAFLNSPELEIIE